jgi:hypothetical protein
MAVTVVMNHEYTYKYFRKHIFCVLKIKKKYDTAVLWDNIHVDGVCYSGYSAQQVIALCDL